MLSSNYLIKSNSSKDIDENKTLKFTKELTIDNNTSKDVSINVEKTSKLKGSFANMIPNKQILNKIDLFNQDPSQNFQEQNNMIENYNRVDVHNLDKWLDFNKSRMSIENY